MDQKTIKILWKKYRVAILAGVASLGLVIILLISGIVWGSFLAVKSLTANSKLNWNQTVTTLEPRTEVGSFVSELVLGLTTQALNSSLESGDLRHVVDGITCVNSFGGPTPSQVIEHMKRNISHGALSSRLEDVEQSIQSDLNKRDSSRCLNWLFNS